MVTPPAPDAVQPEPITWHFHAVIGQPYFVRKTSLAPLLTTIETIVAKIQQLDPHTVDKQEWYQRWNRALPIFKTLNFISRQWIQLRPDWPTDYAHPTSLSEFTNLLIDEIPPLATFIEFGTVPYGRPIWTLLSDPALITIESCPNIFTSDIQLPPLNVSDAMAGCMDNDESVSSKTGPGSNTDELSGDLSESATSYNQQSDATKLQKQLDTLKANDAEINRQEVKINGLKDLLAKMLVHVQDRTSDLEVLEQKFQRLEKNASTFVEKTSASCETKLNVFIQEACTKLSAQSSVKPYSPHENNVNDDAATLGELNSHNPDNADFDHQTRDNHFKYIKMEGDESIYRKFDIEKNEILNGMYRKFQGQYHLIPSEQLHHATANVQHNQPVQMTLVETSQYGRGFVYTSGKVHNPYKQYVQLQQLTKFSAKMKITCADDILVVFKAMSTVARKYNVYLKKIEAITVDENNTKALSALTPANCDNFEAAIIDSCEAMYMLAEKYIDNAYLEGCNIINDLSESRDGFKVWYRLLKKASPHLMDPTYDLEGDIAPPSYDNSLQQYNRSFASFLIKKEILGHHLSPAARVLEYLKHLPAPYASVVTQLRHDVRTFVLQQRQNPATPYPPHLVMEEVYHNTEVLFRKHRDNGTALAAINSLDGITDEDYARLSRDLTSDNDPGTTFIPSGTDSPQANIASFRPTRNSSIRYNRNRSQNFGNTRNRYSQYNQRSRSHSPRRTARDVICKVCGKYGHDFDRFGGYCEFLALSTNVNKYVDSSKKASETDCAKALHTNRTRFEKHQHDKSAVARVAEVVTEQYGLEATVEDISAKVNSLSYNDEMSQTSATPSFYQEEEDFDNGLNFH